MLEKELDLNVPGVDVKRGLELCDGDKSIYLQSLRLFASSMPVTLGKMKSVSELTLKDYAINVHGAKGICEYIGAEDARVNAKQLEMMAKEGNLAGVLAGNDAFIKYAGNLAEGIQNWLRATGS